MTIRYNFRQFRASGGIIAPRSYQVVPSNYRPIAYVNTSNSIRITCITTENASEFQAIPIMAINVPTARTTSAGIFRRNQFKFNPFSRRLILSKELSLSIRPSHDFTSQVFPLSNTGFTDISQIFHNYSPSTERISPSHKPFGGRMHKQGSYGCLVTSHLMQKTTRRTRANCLYLASNSSDVKATGVKFPAMESESFRIHGVCGSKDSFYSRVNSNDTSFCFGFWNIYNVRENQKPLFTNLFKFRILPCFDWWSSWVRKLDWFAPKANALGFRKREVSFPNNRKNMLFVNHFIPFILSFLGLERSRNIFKSGTRELRRQVESFAY